ncbi:MAG: hypothetical protein KDD43_01325 [Bdellovibrionales bacterium]|nr:hypothetical protein [Bdellovibrionales bacterium]
MGFRSLFEAHGLEDIAQEKPDDEFWVGVLGGSLAEMFVHDATARRDFELRLSSLPSAEGRKVRVINLAHGGYKQPQQFIMYSLYGDKLDLAINIEGVNEVSDFLLGGQFPIEYPLTSYRHYYQSSPGQFYLKSAELLVTAVHHLHFGYIHITSFHYSPLVTLGVLTATRLALPLHRYFQNEFVHAYRKAYPNHPKYEDPSLQRQMIATWEKFTRLQVQIAKENGVPLWVFMQPNQYIRDSKVFTDWEQKNVFADHRKGFAPVYENLRRRVRELGASGLPIHDLSQIFFYTKETIYKDDCCHINGAGNLILSAELAKIISSQGQ